MGSDLEAAALPSAWQDEDPAARVDRARRAQRDFERLRRRHYVRDPAGTLRCDEHIGRFCLAHDGDEDWSPAPEHEDVTLGRLELLAALDSAGRTGLAGPWLAGQRVKYRLEADDPEGALAAAAECEPAGWWCEALRGLVHHSDGRWLAAERAFDDARAAMPADTLCNWDDLGPLLEGEDSDVWERMACGDPARGDLAARFWHLADPLWSIPGRERRSEHYARHVWRTIHTGAASGYGLSWGRDLDEITLRYGWPAGWDLAWRRDPGLRTERAVEAHRAPHAQRFVASGVAAGRPSWELRDEDPRTTWAHPAGEIGPTSARQVATFRRGDRRLVVAAARGSAPETPDCEEALHLILASDSAVLATGRAAGPTAARVLEPAYGTARWIGIETVCGADGARTRARLRVRPPPLTLSDILLLEPGEALPGTLDATLGRVRPLGFVRPGEAIVVYWEWYGAAEPVDVTVSLSREGKGVLRKLLEWSGLAGRKVESAGVRWSDPGEDGGPARAVLLELPELSEGEYRLTVQVQSARVGSVSSSRDVVVANGSPGSR